MSAIYKTYGYPMPEDAMTEDWFREIQKGFMLFMVLMVLSAKPRHGYGIMKDIEGATLGMMKPTAGGLYPALDKLEKKGYVKGKWTPSKGKRKMREYEITTPGRNLLVKLLEKKDQFFGAMEQMRTDISKDLLDIGATLTGPDTPPQPIIATIKLDAAKTPTQKLKVLKTEKAKMQKTIKKLEKATKNIDRQIKKLEK